MFLHLFPFSVLLNIKPGSCQYRNVLKLSMCYTSSSMNSLTGVVCVLIVALLLLSDYLLQHHIFGISIPHILWMLCMLGIRNTSEPCTPFHVHCTHPILSCFCMLHEAMGSFLLFHLCIHVLVLLLLPIVYFCFRRNLFHVSWCSCHC